VAQFEVLQGKHRQDEKLYTKGQIVESNYDLVKKFRNKFRAVGAPEVQKTPGSQASESGEGKKAPSAKKPTAPKKAPAREARGTDVTSKFKLANEEGFSVFKRGDLFHVYEGNETTPVKGGEGLKADAVEAFVKAYLEG
jgi:hypothetical protein